MKIGLNVGYHSTKYAAGTRTGKFLSVVGSPDRPRFSLEDDGGIVLEEPQPVLIGEEAITQSRFLNRREDRAWIESDEWYLLSLAALTQITQATSAELDVVTGLPISFYADKDSVRERLEGAHRVKRAGRVGQTLTIRSVNAVPEPFGTLFDLLWDDKLGVRDQRALGEVGILDIGSKTTNMLSVQRIREIGRESHSEEIGGWDVVRALREYLAQPALCPDLKLRDHELAQAVIARQVGYYGKAVDIGPVVDEITARLSSQIVAEASKLWRESLARFGLIVITGGGALLLGDQIRSQPQFSNALIADAPIYANARGYLKYARYLATRG